MRRRLPKMIRHARYMFDNKCINVRDPITQEWFAEIPMERWVICPDKKTSNCWWFDVSSAVQLLGSPGSHAGENPFTRQEYPPEFILDADTKASSLSTKYPDIAHITGVEEKENKSSPEEHGVAPCFNYLRFQEHVKATRLFESFREHGFYFPKSIFMSFNLAELRSCAAKILESWNLYPESERNRLFPEANGQIFPIEFIRRIPTCGSVSELRHRLLDAALHFAVYPPHKDDRASGCINMMMVLGTLNQAAHDIIQQYGLCDCAVPNGPRGVDHVQGNQHQAQVLYGPAPIIQNVIVPVQAPELEPLELEEDPNMVNVPPIIIAEVNDADLQNMEEMMEIEDSEPEYEYRRLLPVQAQELDDDDDLDEDDQDEDLEDSDEDSLDEMEDEVEDNEDSQDVDEMDEIEEI